MDKLQSQQQSSYQRDEGNKALQYDASWHQWLFIEGKQLVARYHRQLQTRLLLRLSRYFKRLQLLRLRYRRRNSGAITARHLIAFELALPDFIRNMFYPIPTYSYQMLLTQAPSHYLLHLPNAHKVWHKLMHLHLKALYERYHDLDDITLLRLLKKNVLYNLDWNLKHGLITKQDYLQEKNSVLRYLSVLEYENQQKQLLKLEQQRLKEEGLSPRERVLAMVKQAQADAPSSPTLDAKGRRVMSEALKRSIETSADFKAVRRGVSEEIKQPAILSRPQLKPTPTLSPATQAERAGQPVPAAQIKPKPHLSPASSPVQPVSSLAFKPQVLVQPKVSESAAPHTKQVNASPLSQMSLFAPQKGPVPPIWRQGARPRSNHSPSHNSSSLPSRQQ